MEVSPFLFVDSQAFSNTDGRIRVPVFNSLTAELAMVTREVADALKRGKIDELPGHIKASLRANRMASDNESGSRREAQVRMEEAASDTRQPVFVLLPASYCNMGCEYCGQEHTRGGLSGNHREAIVKRVVRRLSAPGVEGVRIRWFGGEPLMGFATLRSMSKQMIAAAEGAGRSYSANIVTNGALLDERKLNSLVRDCRVEELHITIDGPERIHDAHRPMKSGVGTFDRLTTFLAKVASDPEYASCRFVLRTNVDVENADYVSEYLETMAAKGFAGARNFRFSLVPVHPWTNDVSRLQIAMRTYAEAEANWLVQMARLGLDFSNLPGSPKAQPCGAVNRSSEVFSSSGAVFSCTEHPLVPEHEENSVLIPIDELDPSRPRPPGEFDDWAGEVERQEVPCGSCWLLPSCGGQCPKLWHEGVAACPSMKFNMADRLSLAVAKKDWIPVREDSA